jgi:hypothetical protein
LAICYNPQFLGRTGCILNFCISVLAACVFEIMRLVLA